jgi:hypothetical protein
MGQMRMPWLAALVAAVMTVSSAAMSATFAVSNHYATGLDPSTINIRTANVFGDSYSRPNRTSFHNWVEQLRYDIINPGTNLPSIRKLLDYGVGAATAGVYPGSTNDFTHQITAWRKVTQTYNWRDITMVYFGYNDFNRTQVNTGVSLAQAFSDYRNALQRLITAGVGNGGRRILLIMPHDWGHTPHWTALGKSAEIRQQTILWNDMIAKLAQQSSYTNFVAVDVFSAIECVFNQPADFGFVNVSDSRPAGADPWTYLYDWDTYHFAEHGYSLIRQVVQYYLTKGWDWSNTYKDPLVARQKFVADLQAGKVFPVKCH